MHLKQAVMTIFLFGLTALTCGATTEPEKPAEKPDEVTNEKAQCVEQLRSLAAKFTSVPAKSASATIGSRERWEQICSQAKKFSSCSSVKGQPIFHFDKAGDTNLASAQRILVLSLIHGDEDQAGVVALSWLNRLQDIQPRNHWRVVPLLNPDGFQQRTRTNANGVDINRNFPSRDWDELALPYWKSKTKENPRRYPGPKPASEPETQCAVAQIDDFKPNFIISVHTPLGVLDFDGPKVEMPKFKPLPWVSLGNFPGSLGRFMWVDRNVPVMTVELKAINLAARQLEEFDRLQDISGTVALQAEKVLRQNPTPPPPPSQKQTPR